jgi:3-deoxy-D-manno-octulosonic acid kinase
MHAPEGYRQVQRESSKALVLETEAVAVAHALFHPRALEPISTEGRGEAYRFPLEAGQGIVRPYRRGGAMARLWRDRYLLVNRPLRELRIHLACYRQGLPVPEPLGAAWQRSGPWVRGAFATRALEAVTLQRYLETHRPSVDVLKAVGACIGRFHERGVCHADLQVRNILIAPEGRVYLIDFDKATKARRLSQRRRSANLARLARSFRKNGLHPSAYETILEGYKRPALTDAFGSP